MQQQDAMEVQFQGKPANVYVMATGGAKESLSQYIENGSLTFDIKIKNIPTEPVLVSVQCGDSDIDREADISGQLRNINSFIEINIPAKQIVLNDNREFDRLFNISTGGNLEAVLANIRWRNN